MEEGNVKRKEGKGRKGERAENRDPEKLNLEEK